MIRETIYLRQSQILRLESLCLRSAKTKSELVRYALESYLRYFGLRDPEVEVLPGEAEDEHIAQYRKEMIQPFEEIMRERGAKEPASEMEHTKT
jgi:hypothetical protein